eukprot:Colp12_sorted_trinity150504_noHs@10447
MLRIVVFLSMVFLTTFTLQVYNLRFPVTYTTIHMFTNFALSSLSRFVLRKWNGEERPVIRGPDFWKKVVPTGLTGALDIALSNTSFLFVTVSLYTMCKSTAIVFLLIFALIFKIEKPKWQLLLVIGLIATGVFMFSYGDTTFDIRGFIMVMTAAMLGGLRWVLTQMLMHKKSLRMHNPIDTLYHITPVMGLAMVPFAAAIEGKDFFTSPKVFTGGAEVFFLSWSIIFAGSITAFLMNVAEFLLISKTSSVTLSVAGIFKEIVTVLLSHVIFGDRMEAINIAGLVVATLGIAYFNVLKYKEVGKQQPSGTSYTKVEQGDMELDNIDIDDAEEDDEDVLFDKEEERTSLASLKLDRSGSALLHE